MIYETIEVTVTDCLNKLKKTKNGLEDIKQKLDDPTLIHNVFDSLERDIIKEIISLKIHDFDFAISAVQVIPYQ